MELRKHQREAVAVARDIVAGTFTRKVVTAKVTPGGGKTLMAALFARELFDAGAIDLVVFVTPRDSLRTQVRNEFCNLKLGLRHYLVERGGSRQQQSLFGEGSAFGGFVITYHEIATAQSTVLKWMKGKRVLIILDECHHITAGPSEESGDGADWHEKSQLLVDASSRVLAMSGTMARDKSTEPISFIQYSNDGLPVLDIAYNRYDALVDEAIVRVEFKRIDAMANYQSDDKVVSIELSKASRASSKRALSSVVDIESTYTGEVVDGAVDEWLAYRREVNAHSKMIVIAATQRAARGIRSLMQAHLRGAFDVALAISDEGQKAKKAIRRFRGDPAIAILVTVGMAYEGLDVPNVTHIVCLTRTRSRPWLEQAFARATRFDRSCGLTWSEQAATIFVPDDGEMRSIITAIQDEQASAVHEKGIGPGFPPRRVRSSFETLGAEKTDVSVTGDRHYTKEESLLMERLVRKYERTRFWSPEEKLRMALDLGWASRASLPGRTGSNG